MNLKKIKVYFGEKRLKDIYPYATKWDIIKYRVIKTTKLIFKIIVLAIVILGVSTYVRWAYPKLVEIEKQVEVAVEPEYPVLDRIAKCESENSHFAKNGQVVVNGNTNGSVDIGKYQINMRVWGKKATELGYNLAVEKDNEEFAKFLYKNYGTEPWVWSKQCWR